MECERCHTTNVDVIKNEKDLIVCPFTFEQYEITNITIKCHTCGHEFVESI